VSILLALQGPSEVNISGAILEGSDSVAGDVDVVVSISGAVAEGSDVAAGTIDVLVVLSGAIQEGSDAAAGTLEVEAADEVAEESPGVRRGKRRIIRLTDVKDRQKTADFIKEQLRIVHEDLIAKDVPQRTPRRIKISQPVLEAKILTQEKPSDDQAAIAAILASIL